MHSGIGPFRWLVPALAFAALPAPALAEDRELPPVTAAGTSDETPAQLADPSAFVSVVPARPGEAATAAEMVSAAPGVVVRDLGLNQAAAVSVRGSSADEVLVLLDGMPLNPAAGGGADLSTLPAPFLSRLSVSRGAVGARYGAGAMGGAVLLETVKPADGEKRLHAELGYGSFNSADLSAGACGGFGRVSGLLAVFARKSDGDFPYRYYDRPQLNLPPVVLLRENNQAERTGALARLLVSGAWKFDLLLEADAGERGIPGTAQAPTPNLFQDDARGLAVARLSRTFGALGLEARAGGRFGRLLLGNRGEPSATPQDERYGFGELSLQTLWGRHALEAGTSAAGESIASAVHGSRARPRLAAWGSDEISLGALSVLPVLRAERIGDASGLSPKLGLVIRLGELVQLKANAGQSFRAPSFGELYLEQGLIQPNPDLRPEQASFADFGAVARLGPVTATASGFYSRYQDLILYELYPGMRLKPFNFGQAQVYGGEFDAGARLGLLSLAASYTLSFSNNLVRDERFYGNPLPYHPQHRGHLRLGAGVEWLEGFAELDAQGAQFTNRTNTVTLPARARLNLGAAWLIQRSSGLWLSAGVKNVFDSSDEDLYGYPLPGRALYASLRVDWSDSPTTRSSP